MSATHHLPQRPRALRRNVLAGVALTCLLAACAHPPQPEPGGAPDPGDVAMPTVDTPVIKDGDGPMPDASRLPKGARALLPNRNVARVFMTIDPRPAAGVSVDQVRAEVVAPLLQAMRFERGVKALRIRSDDGLAQARPRLAYVARQLVDEYEGNKEAIRPRTFEMIDAFTGKAAPTPGVEQALKMARGMTFAQFKADIERQEIVYPFQQVHGDVAIEHTLLLASRWEQQTVTSVRGTLIHRYSIANGRPSSGAGAVGQAYVALSKLRGIERAAGEKALDGPYLVLLPYGNDSDGGVSLRYAWRMIIEGVAYGRRAPFLTWLDAQSGRILKLVPLLHDVTARGVVWRRDPGTGVTSTRFFDVDPSAGGQYTLQLAGVVNRIDYLADGYNANDVSISDSTDGSSATFANFDQAPINQAANAVCSSGGNVTFQQVQFYAQFYKNWQQSNAQAIFTPFPTSAWTPLVESASAGCNAWSDMDFGACQGYYDATCPDYSTGGVEGQNYMNFAHDNTVVAHELAHNSVPRFTSTRPANWCGSPPCAIPLGWNRFHDLTDAWADHFENTNCTAGWVAKNQGGVDASENCQGTRGHVEGSGLPRLHEVTWPFNPAAPGDHFPEHRDAATGGYADMHIPSAALWQLREGMRSKCRPSGHPQFFVRWTRALKNTGFMGADPGNTDLGIYRYLHDLELELIEQWATSGLAGGPPAFAHNGNHTTSKVLAAFGEL